MEMAIINNWTMVSNGFVMENEHWTRKQKENREFYLDKTVISAEGNVKWKQIEKSKKIEEENFKYQ